MRTHRLAMLLLASFPIAALAQAPLKWGAAPAVFPRGAQMAVVHGDPGRAGPFTVHLRMPDGYRIPPHFHPTDEHIRVRSGTFLMGMGDRMDRNAMTRLSRGRARNMKANMHHYAMAQGPTTVEVSANGPFAMSYVNPADAPQNIAKPR